MKRFYAVVIVMALLGLCLIPMSGAQTVDEKSVVRVSGADSMFNRIRVLAKVFTNANPAIQVDIVGGTLVDLSLIHI